MITTKKLQYSDLIETISEEDIAKFYLGVNSKSKMFSYFREETIPGQYLYYNNAGKMQYYDCVEGRSLPYLIMELNSWTYTELMDNIQQDFAYRGNNSSVKKKVFKKTPKQTILDVHYREFKQYDLDWWKQYNINLEILQKFNVKAIKYYFLNNKTCTASKFHYTYDFYYENNIFRRKLYAPKNKKLKWISNGGKICQGENMLLYKGDLLIITKSLKDVMTLYSIDYTAIAPPSESTFLPENYFIKQKKRFNKIVLFFDNDETGIKKAKKFSELYDIPYTYIPLKYEVKDISDFIKKYGIDKTKKLCQDLLENLY